MMIEDEKDDSRDTSYAFKPLEVVPAPVGADAERVTHLDLTGKHRRAILLLLLLL